MASDLTPDPVPAPVPADDLPDGLPDDLPWDLPWDPPTPPPASAEEPQTLTTESTVGRPLTRWKGEAIRRTARLEALFDELQTELAGLLVHWPRSNDVTGDVAVAFDHRDVAWMVTCAQREAAQAAWVPVAGLKRQLDEVKLAVLRVPTGWTPGDTASFNERPDLFGCDPEAPARARQRILYGPWSAPTTTPEAR